MQQTEVVQPYAALEEVCLITISLIPILNSNTADWCKEMCFEREFFLMFCKFLQWKITNIFQESWTEISPLYSVKQTNSHQPPYIKSHN